MPSPTQPSDSSEESPSASSPNDSDKPPGGIAPTKAELDAVVSSRVRAGIAIAVTLVWAASFVADVLSKDYEAPAFIYLTMMTVVGAVMGSDLLKRGK